MVTTEEFNNFADYARNQIASGRAETISQLLMQWEAERDEAESLEAIRQGIVDMEAGRVIPLDQAMAEVRAKLRLSL